ncbi:MAG TPA: glycosyltransferase [Sphingobium sp.]|nr:glycosyltransferase [Sphingobium sp.]
MRILTFLHSFEPGGVERIALRLVREWRDGGVSAPLFMGRSSGAMREELAGDLSYHTPRLPPFAIDWCETIWMILTLPGVIRRLRPDLLFCAGNSYSIVAVAMKLILGRDCPPVLAKISNDLDRHDMIRPARPLYRLWLRIQGRFIDHFVGMEDAMEQEIATLVQPPPGRITIIRDPALSFAQIDRLRALPRRLPCGDGRHFVAAGRLVSQKNFPLMIRAFAKGAGEGDRLVIYGDGPQRAALASLADELGLGNRIRFAGHVPDLASHLVGHDLFLLSSDYEGVPAVLLEALAAGLPIIATQCSRSIEAMLAQGALGRIVPPRDEAALSHAIAQAGGERPDPTASLIHARRFTIETASGAYLLAFDGLSRRRHARKLSPATEARVPTRRLLD